MKNPVKPNLHGALSIQKNRAELMSKNILHTPEKILNKWMEFVNKRDLEKVLYLYNKEAVLIPTFSNRMLNSPAKIRDYFEKLTSRSELSVTLHENTIRIQMISEIIYAVSGIYLWYLSVEDEPLSFEARFSFVFNLNSESPIIHHHSSQIPRML